MTSIETRNQKTTDEANFNCPACDRSGLESIRGELSYRCPACDEITYVVDIARYHGVDDLVDEADYVDWIAEGVCDLEE